MYNETTTQIKQQEALKYTYVIQEKGETTGASSSTAILHTIYYTML